MKAIQTRYYGPTNTRGARIKAWAEGVKSIYIPYPYESDAFSGAAEAATQLAKKYGWTNDLVGGTLPNGDNVFVMLVAP
jgi:hypothetical protein